VGQVDNLRREHHHHRKQGGIAADQFETHGHAAPVHSIGPLPEQIGHRH
jgi:hypothetical protein